MTATHRPTGHGAASIMLYMPSLQMGGTEVCMVRLAEEFVRLGRQVSLAIHQSRTQQLPVPDGVELIDLKAPRTVQAALPLAHAMRRLRPDVLLSALPHNNLLAVAARRIARTQTAVVVTDHAPLLTQIESTRGWRYDFLPRLVRRVYPRADAVVAVSQGVAADQVRMVPGLEPALIANPILSADWQARAMEPVQHRWFEQDGLELVITASRLAPEKDIPTLLRAVARLAPARPMLRLIVAGDGPERPELERLAGELGLRDRVDFVGRVPNPLAWMHRAGVFALASRFEGFGNVIVEALAAGAHVVCTDCPTGPREILQDGRYGALVPVGDDAAFADALALALAARAAERQDRPVDDAPSAADRLAMASEFTNARSAERYLELCDAAVTRRRRAGTAGAADRRQRSR